MNKTFIFYWVLWKTSIFSEKVVHEYEKHNVFCGFGDQSLNINRCTFFNVVLFSFLDSSRTYSTGDQPSGLMPSHKDLSATECFLNVRDVVFVSEWKRY